MTLGKRISNHGGESLFSVLSRWRFSRLKKNTEIRAALLSLEKLGAIIGSAMFLLRSDD
jgi:hypothetical protein